MKKKVLAGLLTSASLLGVCLTGGVSTYAAAIDDLDTEVGIGFTGHQPGQPGPLEIKWAPSDFDFGSANTVNTAASQFSEESGSTKYLVVGDTRGGATDEWKVTAQLSNLMSGTAQLAGAELSFNADMKGYQGTAAPEAPGSIIAAPAGVTATLNASVDLQQGAAAIDVFRDGTAGTGTYQGYSAMEMSDIELDVPGNVAKSGKHYTGTLTWSLEDTI